MKRILSALITGVVLFAGCGPNGPEDLAVYDEDELRAAVALHYEAENASLSGGAARNTNHSGYSGTGFVDGYYYSSTAMVTFTVTVPVAGSYNLTLHYSAGNGTSTNTGLYVNGTKIKNITCNTTYNWELWADVMEMVTLRAGDNTIAWKAESRSGRCINLDYIAVTGGEGTPTYTITAEAGANGSITPDGEVTVNAGAAQNFSVCPDEAYQVGNVTVDGVSRGAVTSYSFSNVTADHTIAVTFIPLQSGGSYEAENATLSGSAARNTNHAGYSGTGFVDGFYYSTNALATFTVNVASAGSYTLTLRYSAGNGTSTNTGLYVNGTKIKNITCNSTGNWETWADQTEPVTLDAGANTIAYKAEARSGRCINLDKITLTAEGCAPLSIRQQPASVEVLCGSTDWVTFTVAVEGNPDCSYHWYAQVPGSTDSMDCAEIPRYFAGATTPQLTTVPDQPKNVWCIITDDCGRRVSTDHNVGFTFTELVITRQPESVTASCGSMDPVTFSVDVSGSARYLYHWYAQWPGSIDSIDCGPETRYYSGGTTAQLTTIPDNAKKVWCIITDDCGRRVSTDHGIGFSFNDMVITREPQSVTAPCGSMDPVTFSVEVSGSARYFYHWYAQWPGSTDSIDCGPETRYYSGGTTAQLTTVPDNAKKVWCIITDDCGHRVATDHNVGFSFNDLVITRQPESIQVPCGSTDRLYFTVETSGSARYFYRWYAQTPGSTDSMDCATIPRYFGGAETEQLICVPDFSKNVWCIITDDCGRRVSTDHSIGFTVPTDCQ